MSTCAMCGVDLLKNHELDSRGIEPMKNGSRIIAPLCAKCGSSIQVSDISHNIASLKKVILISGTVGAGKSTIGQYIEDKYNYVFIDGDAISKKLNHQMKNDPTIKCGEYICHSETINTMIITLGLGYDVVVGYVFNTDDIKKYRETLLQYKIDPLFRVLVPSRDACIERDQERLCWTAGVNFVDRWYAEQHSFRDTHPGVCIDNSNESVEETVMTHFHHLL